MAISSYPGAGGGGSFRSSFYDPNFDYWRGQEFPFGMPEGRDYTEWAYGENNPEAPWTAALARLGYGGLDPKSTWGRSMFNRAQEGYGAAHLQNPVVNWQDYLQTLDLDKLYRQLGPNEKGYSDQQFGGPARWQRRA